MGDTASYYFSPQPSEIAVSRISLDFELRAADLFFRELVVPEVGRIWFVRQLSWPLASLAIYEELANRSSNAPKPTAICHGIEALACKLESWADSDDRSTRILGRRAFGRDPEWEVWSFQQLRRATNYVQNTHRQAATRAIRANGGLGLARGSRFDFLELEPVGRELANDFLSQRVDTGRMSLRKWLLEWLKGDREVKPNSTTLRQALSPEHASKEECALVRSRLLGTLTPASEKRQRLAQAVGRAADMPDIDDAVIPRLRHRGLDGQADEIMAARAFGAVLDRARDVVAALIRAIEPERGGVKLSVLAADSGMSRRFSNLRLAGTSYLERARIAKAGEPASLAFANSLTVVDDGELIRLLVGRAGQLLGLADGTVVRGPLFRVIDTADEDEGLEDGASSIEPDRTGRTFRIANFHELLRDVDRRGAQ